jgi:hypothetical protein
MVSVLRMFFSTRTVISHIVTSVYSESVLTWETFHKKSHRQSQEYCTPDAPHFAYSYQNTPTAYNQRLPSYSNRCCTSARYKPRMLHISFPRYRHCHCVTNQSQGLKLQASLEINQWNDPVTIKKHTVTFLGSLFSDLTAMTKIITILMQLSRDCFTIEVALLLLAEVSRMKMTLWPSCV